MDKHSAQLGGITVLPAMPERWADLEGLFGAKGAYGGCWCMYWRLPRKAFDAGKGEPHRQSLRELVDEGRVPGLLAYADGQAVGWVSLGPREDFPTLERSRILKRVDDQPVWAIVCFYVARHKRRQGVMRALIAGAVDYAAQQGAQVVEAYPVEPAGGAYPDVYAYTGLAKTYRALGFEEAARHSPTRPILRKVIKSGGVSPAAVKPEQGD